MTRAIQIKLLASILAVLVIIATLLAKGGRSVTTLNDQDQKTQQVMQQKIDPTVPRGGWFYKKKVK